MVGSTRDFKPADSMLSNFFGYHVPSDLLHLEDVLKHVLVPSWQYAALTQ
jgi:hypothetical protein